MKLLDNDGSISEEIRSIIENTNDLMFVKNRDFVYIASSRAFARDCVRCNSVEDVIGKTDFELFEDREIAERYREDDEHLFASGKAMIEFQEEYPGKEGRKHRCLTTKYLLHNKEGEPIALFGQYHNVGEQVEMEIARNRDMNQKVSLSMVRSFFVSNYVDLASRSYETLWAVDYVRDMLKGCDTIEQGFDAFIDSLVRAEYVEKVREFCDISSIDQRLDGKRRIDCEYLSKYASGWSRASFYPVDWNEDGKLTHVLFTVSPIDEVKAKEIEEGISNKHDLESIFDSVPGGIVLYEWTGEELKVLRMSKYCQDLYGHSMINSSETSDYLRIHPDDIADYQKAMYVALTKTHELEYVFRVWNQRENRYVWSQINAISKPQSDGTSLVYCMYSDVTAQKEAELKLEKKIHLEKRAYESQMRNLLYSNGDALCMCNVNLTKNTFSHLRAESIVKRCAEQAGDLDSFMNLASQAVFEDERAAYRELFNSAALLERYRSGQTHISFEHFCRIDETHTEWVETALDLMENPLSGDIVGVCCAKSLNEEKMSRILLDATLEKDYLVATLVYSDTGEYYRYETDLGEHCEHRQQYWETLARRLEGLAKGENLKEIRRNLSKQTVLSRFEQDGQYTYAFDGSYGGETFRLEASFRAVDRKRNLMLATLRNITDAALYEEYKHKSEHDALTGLLNRKTAFERSRQILDEHPDEEFVVLHCDVRHFHLYNTFYGEEAGSELLCKIADIMTEMGRDHSHWAYGRIESDVFFALFPADIDVFERHVRFFLGEIAAYRDDFPLQAAIGTYWVGDRSMSIEAMFSRATIAAKSGEKNLFGLVSRFDEKMEQDLQDAQQITSEMNAAIAQEQFEVYLQPKYSLRTEKLVGAEALVRWVHPQRGMISPGKFIPAFEKNGFIAELDRYMWEHVCMILRKWQDAGQELYPVSVNMSRVSLYSHATVPFLKSLVEKYGIEPKYLELELTETAYMDDPEDLKRMLKELQDYGFKILMDDFGSGYSSLNTLRELPVNVLKLDMKFMTESQNDVRGAAVLSSVVRMSKLLYLPIVAEGVEKREQADYLREIGCEYVQGYLFARPMPVDQYEELLAEIEAEAHGEAHEADDAPFVLEDPRDRDALMPAGVLEYGDGRFAYLHANKLFLAELGLADHTDAAPRVLRERLGERGYGMLLQALSHSVDTQSSVMVRLASDNDGGGEAGVYCGYVHCNGSIGSYADMSAVLVNVSGMDRFGFEGEGF